MLLIIRISFVIYLNCFIFTLVYILLISKDANPRLSSEIYCNSWIVFLMLKEKGRGACFFNALVMNFGNL